MLGVTLKTTLEKDDVGPSRGVEIALNPPNKDGF